MYTEIIIYTVVLLFSSHMSKATITLQVEIIILWSMPEGEQLEYFVTTKKISWHEEQWQTKREDALHSGIMSRRNISILND